MPDLHPEPIAIILIGLSMSVLGVSGLMGWIAPNQMVMGLLLTLLVVISFLAGRRSAGIW